MRFHWQNLSNEDEHGQGRGIPWHGRAWWNWTDRWGIKWEWVFKAAARAGVSVEIDQEDGAGFSIRLFLFALYVHLVFPGSYRLMKNGSREIELRYNDRALWWNLWRDPMGEWSRRVPRWRHGSFHFDDFFLGRAEHSERDIRTETVPIPLPEGTIRATVRLYESTWKRKRWPFPKRLRRAEITPEKPAPVPGKGENSWDCGPDAIYGMTTTASSSAEAVGHFVESVLRTRRKRGAAWDYAERAS